MTRRLLFFDLFAMVVAFKGNVVLKDLGEKEYQTIQAKSNLPIHGACWHNALKALKSGCDQLNDHEHSLLAMTLANCFLHDSGHVTYDCFLSETESSRRECINSMSDRAFGVYNEFYTHTTYMCFFLNHELWQAETENTIKQGFKQHLKILDDYLIKNDNVQNVLSDKRLLSAPNCRNSYQSYFTCGKEILKPKFRASTRMKEQLVEASEIQGIVLESQKEGLRIQNELLDHGKELGSVIRSSAETVSSMVVDFKETAKDQRELLYEIFSYMRTFQNWILGEVSWFQSIVYYMVACILCALFSSSKRTAEARISLFTILSLNVVVERMLVQYHNNIKKSSPDDKLELVNLSWHFRKVAILTCFITLFYTYYSYNDGNYENYKVLQRIENQLNSLQVEPQPLRYSKRLALKKLKDIHAD